METAIKKTVDISAKNVGYLEHLLGMHGFRHFTVFVSDNGKSAVITFYEDFDATLFVLKDLLSLIDDDSVHIFSELDVDFMISLEKKLKTYSKHDEYVIRKILKDT
jgi:hypothetical protein